MFITGFIFIEIIERDLYNMIMRCVGHLVAVDVIGKHCCNNYYYCKYLCV